MSTRNRDHGVHSKGKRKRRQCPACHGRKVFMHGDTFVVKTCHKCAGKGWIL